MPLEILRTLHSQLKGTTPIRPTEINFGLRGEKTLTVEVRGITRKELTRINQAFQTKDKEIQASKQPDGKPKSIGYLLYQPGFFPKPKTPNEEPRGGATFQFDLIAIGKTEADLDKVRRGLERYSRALRKAKITSAVTMQTGFSITPPRIPAEKEIKPKTTPTTPTRSLWSRITGK